MPIDITKQFTLPRSTTGPAFSVAPAVVLGEHGTHWTAVQQMALDALHLLAGRHGTEACAWFCVIAPPTSQEGESRLGLIFLWDSEADGEHIATLHEALRASGAPWTSAGLRPLPRRAFPSLALRQGGSLQLWVQGRTSMNAPRLEIDDGDLLQTRTSVAEAEQDDFLGGLEHASAITPEQQAFDADPIETYKVVFALSVCERIIESDGEVTETEVEFLRRVFPQPRLHAMGLTDRVRFLGLRMRAAAALVEHLDDDAKLGLMGLFWRAGQSDGHVAREERSILRDAAAQLHLDWDVVEAYLRDLW